MPKNPSAFLTYARVDNKDGSLTRFRDALSHEVELQTGEAFPIFMDNDIQVGQDWAGEIKMALRAELPFLIPIVTPSFLKSKECREEMELFLEREKELERNDLVMPIYYIRCPVLEAAPDTIDDKFLKAIATHQRVDWQKLRLLPFDNIVVKNKMAQIAGGIARAIERVRAAQDAQTSAPVLNQKGTSKTGIAPALPKSCKWAVVYSRSDKKWADELRKRLHPAENCGGTTQTWQEIELRGGRLEDVAASPSLLDADIVLVLISVAYMHSGHDQCTALQVAMKRHAVGAAIVIPILVQKVELDGTVFAGMRCLPSDQKSVRHRDEAIVSVSADIVAIAEEHIDALEGRLV